MGERRVRGPKNGREAQPSSVPGEGAPPRPPAARRGLLIAALIVLLAAVTLLVYAPVRTFDFVGIDDPVYVAQNPLLRDTAASASVARAFTSTYANFWHPLTILSLMLDARLFGLRAGPMHVTAVLLHLAATLVLLLALLRATRAPGPSAFVAALFAVHPLHVESVAWIAQRKDVLSTLFWMLTLVAYVEYARARRWPRYILALVLFALGLMAKPMLVTLPFTLLLLDAWPLARVELSRDPASPGRWPVLSRGWLPLLLEKLPFVALTIAASIVAFWAQQRQGAVASLEQFPLAARLANAPVAYLTYLWKTFWPTALAVFYPYPLAPRVGAAVAAALVLLAISLLALRAAPRRPYLAVGWFWFVGTLVPVSGLVQVGSHAMGDRYTYVPLVGLFIAITWGAAEIAGRLRARPLPLAATACAVVAALALAGRAQVMTWRSSATLWQHALDVMPDNYYAHNALGLELVKQGRRDEARQHFARACELAPGFPNCHNNLGLLLAEEGRGTQAIAEYQEALRRSPEYPQARVNLGNALMQAGRAEEAIPLYEAAARLGDEAARANLAQAHESLGIALARAGRGAEARNEFEAALRLDPRSASARSNLGFVLLDAGRLSDAVEQFRAAVDADRNHAQAHVGLGTALFRLDRPEEALVEHAEAVRLAPDLADAHYNLAVTLQRTGHLQEAVAEYERTLRLEGESADLHLALGLLLEQLGRRRESSSHYAEALELQPGLQPASAGLARISRTAGGRRP